MKIRIGTRKSPLALKQTEEVVSELKKINPKIKFEIIPILTKGDQLHHKPLRDVFDGGKLAFTSELHKALKKNKIDIAVHSMKDVAGNEKSEKTIFAAFLKRRSANDVLLVRNKILTEIKKLPKNSIIGTVSLRRKAAILKENKNVIVKNLRGNIESRIEKLKHNYTWQKHKPIFYDAIIMAKAALERSGKNLNLDGLYCYDLPVEIMLPAAGQGVIGVECRTDDKEIYNLLRKINHKKTELTTLAEREFLYGMQGNCHTAIGVYAEIKNAELKITGVISEESGKNSYKITRKTKKLNQPEKTGSDAAKKLIEKITNEKGTKYLKQKLNAKQN